MRHGRSIGRRRRESAHAILRRAWWVSLAICHSSSCSLMIRLTTRTLITSKTITPITRLSFQGEKTGAGGGQWQKLHFGLFHRSRHCRIIFAGLEIHRARSWSSFEEAGEWSELFICAIFLFDELLNTTFDNNFSLYQFLSLSSFKYRRFTFHQHRLWRDLLRWYWTGMDPYGSLTHPSELSSKHLGPKRRLSWKVTRTRHN